MRYFRLIEGNTQKRREGLWVELLEVQEAGASEEGSLRSRIQHLNESAYRTS